jgi:hypothetical protein
MRARPLISSPPWTAGDDELLRSLLAAGTSTVIVAYAVSPRSATVLANSDYYCPPLGSRENLTTMRLKGRGNERQREKH